MISAAEIAAALGSSHRSGEWWRCVCPVHGSRTGHSATLALKDGEKGLIVVCHAGCNRRDVLAELRRRRLIDSHCAEPDSAIFGSRIAREPDWPGLDRAGRTWKAARHASGTPLVGYFAGRGITIAPLPSLRYAPYLRHPSGIYLPAMVARIENIAGELIGIHRTYLRPDGRRKTDFEPVKAMLGRASGGAVRLAPAGDTLMVGEGIETCLAAMQATAMPAWAALSTSGMTRLMLPSAVREVIVLADHDLNGAGERAARIAADRWCAEGRRVRIAIPAEPGADFNDVLLGDAGTRTEVRDVAA